MHITTNDIKMNKKRRLINNEMYGILNKNHYYTFFFNRSFTCLSIDLTMFPLQIYIFFIALNAMDKNKNIITTPVRDGSWGYN